MTESGPLPILALVEEVRADERRRIREGIQHARQGEWRDQEIADLAFDTALAVVDGTFTRVGQVRSPAPVV